MCVNDEHLRLHAALRSRDPDAARSAMADHLDHVLDRLNLDRDEAALPDLELAFQGII
jgi:DNA-binding FadR family transcriptional regulator